MGGGGGGVGEGRAFLYSYHERISNGLSRKVINFFLFIPDSCMHSAYS